MKQENGKNRRKVSLTLLIVTGVVIGLLIKNVRAGLLIGLVMGLLIIGLANTRR
jgi:mannose/fructose/N-acetylgalactosamine-specific phosphotransferase system component IIC